MFSFATFGQCLKTRITFVHGNIFIGLLLMRLWTRLRTQRMRLFVFLLLCPGHSTVGHSSRVHFKFVQPSEEVHPKARTFKATEPGGTQDAEGEGMEVRRGALRA